MLIRLSIKNIRKSIKDYAIYFFTLVLGVCIFYVFNAIEGQSSMLEVSRTKSDSIDQMVWAISSMSIVVSLILGFLIVYAKKKPGIWNLSDTWNEKRRYCKDSFR